MLRFVELRGDPLVHDHQIVLAGKCLEGPIRAGDRFTCASTNTQTGAVDLVVSDIVFYGQLVSELDVATAGELVLRSEAVGLWAAQPGVLLRGPSTGGPTAP